jgi:cephalosporin hydroxylase
MADHVNENPKQAFLRQKQANIQGLGDDPKLLKQAQDWLIAVSEHGYSYNFTWMGRPIIQFPQDIVAMQEIIFQVKPDLIVETGIAHGGSLIFYASMLELLGGDRRVVGIDIDIREHNRVEIENHPMFKRITMLEGSSIDTSIADQVRQLATNKASVLVVLDSMHTHDHVLKELELYSPLVTKGSYLVVFDTIVESMPDDFYPDRPWSRGDNPATALESFLKTNDRFQIDTDITSKLLITVAPDGYLKCIRD